MQLATFVKRTDLTCIDCLQILADIQIKTAF